MTLHSGVFTNDVLEGETPGGTVVFTNTDFVSHIRGKNGFYNLTCATPGKELQFEAKSSVTNTILAGGALTLRGAADAEGQRVKIRSTVSGTAASLCVAGSASVKYADVQDSDASSGNAIAAEDSIGEDANNTNWSFVSVKPGDEIVWTGTADANWANPANWLDERDKQRLPIETDVVKIGASGQSPSFWPTLADAVTLNQLEIAAGAALTLGGANLTVTNGLSCLGTLTANGSETLTFSRDVTLRTLAGGAPALTLTGAADQTLALNGQTFGTVTVTKDGGSLAVTENLVCAKLLYSGMAMSAIDFTAGVTLTADELRLDAADGDTATLTLEGATSETWNISVVNLAVLSGIRVRDSAASSDIYADNPSENLGYNNAKWHFGSRTASWVGGASGAYDVAGNWSDGMVPDATTRLLLDTTASISIGADKTLSVREVLAQDGTVTFSGSGALDVATTFLMESGTTNVLDVPLTVGLYADIRSGATLTHSGPHALDATNRVMMTVHGDMSLAGTIDVTGKGWQEGVGPACATVDFTGSSHGGRSTSERACYGQITAPDAPGSGGLQRCHGNGGGVVRLVVDGTLTLNGSIVSDASVVSFSSGSGGSVWITAGDLVGSGDVYARGGDITASQYGGYGSGGRIAVSLTEASDFGRWTGSILACGARAYSEVGGTWPNGPAGTVYRQASGWARGELIVDNDDGSMDCGIDLPVTNGTSQALSDYINFNVIVRNGGAVGMQRDLFAQRPGIADLDLATTNAQLRLNGFILTIHDYDHRNRAGWKGTVTEDGGAVRWRSIPLKIYFY